MGGKKRNSNKTEREGNEPRGELLSLSKMDSSADKQERNDNQSRLEKHKLKFCARWFEYRGPPHIRTNSFLTGCGTINGSVLVDAGGTVLADCGGTMSFSGSVTNNGAMTADNGTGTGANRGNRGNNLPTRLRGQNCD